MKILVAIPAYDGKLLVQSVIALMTEQALCIANGDELQIRFSCSNAGLLQSRNVLVKDFLESGYDKMVFLDSDITFEPGAIIKLAYMPFDFVGGCYRYKKEPVKYPINFLPDQKDLWINRVGLIEVASLPTGFLSLSRKVFETIKENHPERALADQGEGNPAFCYFQMPFIDGQFYGEDVFLCKEWREAGGKIYMDPEIKLTHWSFNPTAYEGRIGDWIKSQQPENQKGI